MRIEIVIAASVLGCAASATFGVTYDEGINGDLSNNRLSPTNVGSLPIGTHTLTATSISGDREFWRIDIPAGAQISQLVVASYTGEDATAFNAVQVGTTFTEDPDAPDVANILGYTHFGPGAPTAGVGDDILDNMGAGAGAIGFTPPLPGGGSYTFWTQQTGVDSCTYTFSIVVTAATPPTCDGDVNGDGSTNTSDFNIIAGNFGGGPGLTHAQGDLSGDGFVNTSDFNILAGDYGCAP